MDAQQVIDEIEDKFGEYLEMEGARAPLLVNNILLNYYLRERNKVEFLEERLKNLETK